MQEIETKIQKNARNWDSNSTTWDQHARKWDENARTWDKNASNWDENATKYINCRLQIYNCVDRPEDTVEHTVEVCPAWAEHRRVLVEAIGGGDLSRPALVQAMVRSERKLEAVTSFCEAVMLAKEEAERVRERQMSRFHAPNRRRRRRPGNRESRGDFRSP